MPHCILEYSANLNEQFNASDLFKKLHSVMIKSGPFDLNHIKSRVVRHEQYLVGDGNTEKSFIYLQIAILSGREKDIRRQLSARALKVLEETFPHSFHDEKCSITVEVREIDRETHSRSIKPS